MIDIMNVWNASTKHVHLMLNVIFAADMEQTGKFFAYDGSEIAC
jgi:hypothetical protein